MKYNKVPTDLLDTMAIGSGIIVKEFDIESQTVTGEPLCSTGGGISFTYTPNYMDLGEGIDNLGTNLKGLKTINGETVTISGTAMNGNADFLQYLVNGETTTGKITPKSDIEDVDYKDLWFVVDYGANGTLAILIKNALSTGGLQIQSVNKDKGTFAYTFTGHRALGDLKPPFELYVKEGE